MSMKYSVALKQFDEGYSVSCPGLPGCWSQGVTEEGALENIRVTIQEYIEVVGELLKGKEVRSVTVAV